MSRDGSNSVEIPPEIGSFHVFYRRRDNDGDVSRQNPKTRPCTNSELGIEESENSGSLFYPALFKDSEEIVKKYSRHMNCFDLSL